MSKFCRGPQSGADLEAAPVSHLPRSSLPGAHGQWQRPLRSQRTRASSPWGPPPRPTGMRSVCRSHFRGGAPNTSLPPPPTPVAQREPMTQTTPTTRGLPTPLTPATPTWATPCPSEHTLHLTHTLPRLVSRTSHPARCHPQTPRLLWGPGEWGSPRNSNSEPPGCWDVRAGGGVSTSPQWPRGWHSNPCLPSQLSDAGSSHCPQVGANDLTVGWGSQGNGS